MQSQSARARRILLVGFVAAITVAAVRAEAHTEVGTAGKDFPTGIFDPDDPRNPGLEALVWNALTDSGTALTSIESVACSDTECEIVFTGSDFWPDLQRHLSRINWGGVGLPFFKMWSLGRREVSPGAEVRVLNMSSTCPSSKGCELPEGAVALNSPEGRVALRTHLTTLQHAHHRYQNGLMDQESFDAQERTAADLLRSPFVVDWWATNRHGFSASFQDFVDGIVERKDGE